MTSLNTVTPAAPVDFTPAGLQRLDILNRRRLMVAGLNITTYLALVYAVTWVLGQSGWSLIDGLMLVAFLLAAPWSVLGFWNAMIGLWLVHGRRDGLRSAAPFAVAAADDRPLASRVAVLLTLRNENTARAIARLRTIKRSLDATDDRLLFDYFVLSDTNDAGVAAAEAIAIAEWRQQEYHDAARLFYRRRSDNTGFKAGNLFDFCARWGSNYTFMLPLDADSLMSGEAILRLVRIGEAYPKIGILQSLVVGLPSDSAFARIFQFGMRHGMRTYTMGNAWWAGDCGPFWGHNALVRIAPFAEHCALPTLPGQPPFGGAILSHDQVEAVLMRRAGYEVRVLPEEGGSYEDNPPNLLEFSRRELRWCQGNLQYARLLGTPGLQWMSRFQLVWAIMMFIGVPGWTLMLALAAIKPIDGHDLSGFPRGATIGLYLVFLLLYLAPKLTGFVDIVLTEGQLARYGGGARFGLSVLCELSFSFLLGAVTTLQISMFIVRLLLGRSVAWSGQARDASALSWQTAASGLWPDHVFAVGLAIAMAQLTPALIVWTLPLTLGYVLATPFAVVTASPAFGRLLRRWKICTTPEELCMPREVKAICRAETKSVLLGNDAGGEQSADFPRRAG
jgi:membrane glycosyltransferase